MRARLKPKLIQASMAKNRNKRHQPKNPVKLHKFPSGKSRKPEGETLGVTGLKKKMNQIKPRSKTKVSSRQSEHDATQGTESRGAIQSVATVNSRTELTNGGLLRGIRGSVYLYLPPLPFEFLSLPSSVPRTV
jgi:hypothetical protein